MKKSARLLFLLGCALLPTLLFAQANAGDSQSALAKCLPPGIKLSDIVEAPRNSAPPITVEQKLRELKATCNGTNKLIDGDGREIVFFPLQGCWGNPPADYQEILQNQRRQIEQLRQDHTVIEMTCNPSGVRIP